MTDLPVDPPAGPEPPLDRTISPIAGRLTSAGRGKALAFAGLLAGCAAVAFGTWRADRPKPAKPRELPARQVVAFEPAAPPPTLADPGRGAPRLDGAAYDVPALETSATDDGPASAAARTAPSPTEVARKSPLIAYARGGGDIVPRPDVEPALPVVEGAADAHEPIAELDVLRRDSTISRAAARPVGDRNFLILAGSTIPCILQTAIDTTTAGYVTCLVDRDVYSDNGAVVLLEKGARVLGEYRTGMRQGEARIFVLWSRAVTPNGVAIALASPASDALGRAGFGGAVDTHFWARFGAALLLSVVGDASSALVDGKSQTATVRLPSDAAGLAVQQGADIAPTLRKPQGSEVAIQVAQDLDFSAVYALRARP
jgi:type IV secretion system protein VirB10